MSGAEPIFNNGRKWIKMFYFFFSPYFFSSSSLYPQSINRTHGFATVVSQLAHLWCKDVFQLAVGSIDVLRVSVHYYVDMLVVHLGASVCVCGLGHYGLMTEEFSIASSRRFLEDIFSRYITWIWFRGPFTVADGHSPENIRLNKLKS